MTKRALTAPVIAGAPIPGRESRWFTDAIFEFYRAAQEWADNDADFEAEYNAATGAMITSFVPVLTPGSGAFTSASATCRALKIGRIVRLQLAITIVTNGTAAGSIGVSLPYTPAADYFVIPGLDRTANLQVNGIIPPATAALTVTKYDGTYPGADGKNLVLTGFYEASS